MRWLDILIVGGILNVCVRSQTVNYPALMAESCGPVLMTVGFGPVT